MISTKGLLTVSKSTEVLSEEMYLNLTSCWVVCSVSFEIDHMFSNVI